MRNKKPRNKKGEPHGYWKVKWSDGGGFKSYSINGVDYGYSFIDWGKGKKEIDKLYYAR